MCIRDSPAPPEVLVVMRAFGFYALSAPYGTKIRVRDGVGTVEL